MQKIPRSDDMNDQPDKNRPKGGKIAQIRSLFQPRDPRIGPILQMLLTAVVVGVVLLVMWRTNQMTWWQGVYFAASALFLAGNVYQLRQAQQQKNHARVPE